MDYNKKVERLAQKHMKGQKIGNSDIAKEAKKYANRIKRFKESTGRKTVDKVTKEALHYVTPAALKSAKKINYFQNLMEYEKKFGKPDVETARALQYVSAKSFASKMSGGKVNIDKETAEEIAESAKDAAIELVYPNVFSTPDLGSISWYALPMAFRASRAWPHSSGSFIYNNADVFWVGEMVDLDRLAKFGVDGFDHTVSDFFGLVMAKIRTDIVFLSGVDSIWYTTREEWNSATATAPNFLENRRYR